MLAVTQSPDHWSRSWYCWHLTRPPWLDLPWWSCGTGRSGDQLLDRYKVYNVSSIPLWVTQIYCCTTGNGTGGKVISTRTQTVKPRASGILNYGKSALTWHWANESRYTDWLSNALTPEQGAHGPLAYLRNQFKSTNTFDSEKKKKHY